MPLSRLQVLAAGLCYWVAAVCSNDLFGGQEVAAVQAAEGAVKVESAPAAPVAIGPDGKPVTPAPPGAPGKPGQPTPSGQPSAEGQKPDEKKDQGPKVVARPDKPPLPPDPRELKVEPNPEGKLRFNFHGQPWADVLEWLARVSGMSLDWQELPGDYLNLVTQREYTVAEARDLVNRHLLARGFTLLEQGEVLSVVNIQKLNPGMVPRVEPGELGQHMPHKFVKVSFPLDWLLSEKAVEELKPMLSPNAKITPLKNTNRVEALDAVINLREVYEVLKREQSQDDEQRLVKEFVLQHTRATDVLQQLQTLLGIEPKSSGPARGMSPQQMEMMQQQQQQMMMQMQQRGGAAPMPQPKKEDDVRLVANARKNSIMANAPPDKMEIISQAVAAIDVETDRTHSLLANINRMQVYRLHSVDPDALVRTLLEIGEMDPATRLEVDTKNKAVIAYASLADHLTIRQLVERLDGSTRRFEVIPLRRLESDYVAGTIEFMMSGPQKQEQQPRYYDFFYSPYRRNDQAEQSEDKFRVDADVENNRLLLWANEVEMQEVHNLLVKLGEVPPQGGREDRIRVLGAIPPEEVGQLIEKLRLAWPSLAPNPLQLPPPPPPTTKSSEKSPIDARQVPKEARSQRPVAADAIGPVALLQIRAEAAPDKSPPPAAGDEDERPSQPPADGPSGTESPSNPAPAESRSPGVPDRSPSGAPISVALTPDGRLMISSQDTQALDVLEELISQVAPARRDYRVFKLKHADSFWVSIYLEKFFTEGEDKKSSGSRYVYYYDNYSPNRKDEPRYRLSKRRKLKFIDDPDTNSILVQGADSEQLKTIEDLIAVYDQPQQADANAARLTAAFQIKYSKAQTIAEAVKDVYRDLLSSNDKALQNNNANAEQRNRPPSSATTYIFNEGGDSNNEKERTRVTFKGKLSIGVDEITNTLLVSAEGDILMRNVTEMIKALDEAAKPLAAVSVVKLGGNTNTTRVREVLDRLLRESQTAPKKGPGPRQPQQQQPVVGGPQEAEAAIQYAPR